MEVDTIKEYIQKNTMHGAHEYFELLNGNFIVCDLGNRNITLKELKEASERVKKEKNIIPHATTIISHLHTDHIDCFEELIKLHNEKILVQDAIYVPGSVKDCSYILELLKNNKEISIKELTGSKEEQLEIIAMMDFCYGTDTDYKNVIKKLIKESSYEFLKKDIKDAKDKVFERWASENIVNDPTQNKTITERTKDNLKKLFEVIASAEKSGIKVSSTETYFHEQIYGVDVAFLRPSNDEIRKTFDKWTKEGILCQDIGIKTFFKYCYQEDIEKINKTSTSSLIGKGKPFFNRENIEKRLKEVPKTEEFMFLVGLHVTSYLINHCNFNIKEEFFSNEKALEGQVARALIGKFCNHEMNQENIYCVVGDEYGVYAQPGDCEMVQEIYLYLSYKYNEKFADFPLAYRSMLKPHHGSPTSFFFPLHKLIEQKSLTRFSEKPLYINDCTERDEDNYSIFSWLRQKVFDLKDSYFRTPNELIVPYITFYNENGVIKNNYPELLFDNKLLSYKKEDVIKKWENKNSKEQEKELKQFEKMKLKNFSKEDIVDIMDINEKRYQELESEYNKNTKDIINEKNGKSKKQLKDKTKTIGEKLAEEEHKCQELLKIEAKEKAKNLEIENFRSK